GFVRHSRGAATGNMELAHFRLGEEENVDADLAERAGDEGEPARELGNRVARRMPGRSRDAKPQLPRQCRLDRRPFLAERRLCSGRPTKRNDEKPRPQLMQPDEVALERRNPSGDLRTEGDRYCGLK